MENTIIICQVLHCTARFQSKEEAHNLYKCRMYKQYPVYVSIYSCTDSANQHLAMHVSMEDLASHNKPGSFRFKTRQASALPVSANRTSSLKPIRDRISTAAEICTGGDNFRNSFKSWMQHLDHPESDEQFNEFQCFIFTVPHNHFFLD